MKLSDEREELPATLTVARYVDPLVETHGYSVLHSDYPEMFWLPIVGPKAFLLARACARLTAAGPVDIATRHLAASIGLGRKGLLGKGSPITATVHRLRAFDLAAYSSGYLRVRTHLAPLTSWQVTRLPEYLQAIHESDATHDDQSGPQPPVRPRR